MVVVEGADIVVVVIGGAACVVVVDDWVVVVVGWDVVVVVAAAVARVNFEIYPEFICENFWIDVSLFTNATTKVPPLILPASSGIVISL